MSKTTITLGEIAGDEDLKRAIRIIGRAADRDAERAHIIERANALGLAELVPDSWGPNGSLREAAWTLEQRETANDVFVALQGALEDALEDQFSTWSIWVQDWDGGTDRNGYRVIYCAGGDVYAAPFEFDENNKLTVGVADAAKVRPITLYVERAKPSARLEWRKKKAGELRGLERRHFDFSTAGLELREKDEDTWNLTGYACVTNTPYEVGFYSETIKRGAFKRTLSENPDVQLLINHEDLPLARTRSGTLRLEERLIPDADGRTGLWVDADLDKRDPDAQRLERKMARGDIDQMSFAFQCTDPNSWNDDYTSREIKSVSIHRGDVSVVNQGANPATVASIRSTEALEALRRLGPDALVAAMIEWRDHTLLALEQRAGKALSAATMEVLTRVLELVASADEAVDEAQPLLADLMGVANPDADEDGDEASTEDGAEDGERAVAIPDYTTRARQALALLEMSR